MAIVDYGKKHKTPQPYFTVVTDGTVEGTELLDRDGLIVPYVSSIVWTADSKAGFPFLTITIYPQYVPELCFMIKTVAKKKRGKNKKEG